MADETSRSSVSTPVIKRRAWRSMVAPPFVLPVLQRARLALFVALMLAAILWVSSLAFVGATYVPLTWQVGQALHSPTDSETGIRDLLVLRVSLADVAVQPQRGTVIWQVGPHLGQMPFSVISDSAVHEVFIPVGLHPLWLMDAGSARTFNLQWPHQESLIFGMAQASLIHRPPWAIDTWVGRTMALVLHTVPSYKASISLTALIFVGLGWIVWPFSRGSWPGQSRRVAAALKWIPLSLALLVVVPNLIGAFFALPVIWARNSLSHPDWKQLAAPHYADSAAINTLLAQAVTDLPNAPVLLRSRTPAEIYLQARAQYILFPRSLELADAARVETARFSGVIQPAMGIAPGPGWQRVAGPLAGYEVWRTPNKNLPPALSVPLMQGSPWQPMVGFALATTLIFLLGLMLGMVLRLDPALCMACALPIGSTVVALLMVAQSSLGVRWSAATIGFGLCMVCSLGLVWLNCNFDEFSCFRARIAVAFHSTSRFERSALLGIGALSILAALIAVSQPFADQDAWTTWGFNSRAFYVQGNLMTALQRYGNSGLNHPGYPPALPLNIAWLFYAMGGIDEAWVKLSMALWYVSSVALLWLACRRLAQPNLAAGCALLWAGTPLVIDHASLLGADLPFTTLLIGAAIFLLSWLRSALARDWLLAVGLLISAVWVKLDGIYLGLALLALAALWRMRMTGLSIFARTHGGSTLLGSLLLLSANGLWMVFASLLRLKGESLNLALLRVNGLVNLGRGCLEMITEMLLSHTNSTWSLLGADYGLLWPLGFGVVFAASRKAWRDPAWRFLVSSVLAIALFYVLIYALRPFFSMERYLLHAAPLLLMAAARAAHMAQESE